MFLFFHDFLDAEDTGAVAYGGEVDAALQVLDVNLRLVVGECLSEHGLTCHVVKHNLGGFRIFVKDDGNLVVGGVRIEGEAAKELFFNSLHIVDGHGVGFGEFSAIYGHKPHVLHRIDFFRLGDGEGGIFGGGSGREFMVAVAALEGDRIFRHCGVKALDGDSVQPQVAEVGQVIRCWRKRLEELLIIQQLKMH